MSRPAGLTANAAPLLRIVNNEPHASELDHEQPEKIRSSKRLVNANVATQAKDSNKRSAAKSKNEKVSKTPSPQDEDDPEREPESDEDVMKASPPAKAKTTASESKKIKALRIPKFQSYNESPTKGKKKSEQTENDDDNDKVETWLKDEAPKHSKAKKAKSKSKQTYSKTMRREFKQPPRISGLDEKDPKGPKFVVPPSLEPKAAVFQNPMEGIEDLFTGLPALKTTSIQFQAVPTTPDLTPAGNTSQSSLASSPKLPKPIVFKCPNCSAPVDKTRLDAFKAKYPFPLIREEQAFCKEHKKADGKMEWDKRGYPEIEWDKLEGRMEKLLPSMTNLLENPETSFYRKQFQHSVEKGEGRNLSLQFWGGQGMKEASAGYYGTKGLSMMMDFITPNLAQEIRRHASSDKLLFARDVSGYIQMVLAPEMASMLVMEDLNVDERRAREILDESTELGCVMFGERHVEPSDAQKKMRAREAKEKEKAEKKAARAVMSSPSRITRSSPRGKNAANVEVVEIPDTPKKRSKSHGKLEQEVTPKRTRRA